MQTCLKDNFILSLSLKKIQAVNARDHELQLIIRLVRSMCTVAREGRTKTMTYSLVIKPTGKSILIKLILNLLVALDDQGWDPLTPVNVGKESTKSIAICFKKKTPSHLFLQPSFSYSEQNLSIFPVSHSFCLELRKNCELIFHGTPNFLLAELVDVVSSTIGLAGVSKEVHSVISDYTSENFRVFDSKDFHHAEKQFIKLQENSEENAEENLEDAFIACLARNEFKMSLSANVSANSKVFFFIAMKDTNEVRHLSRAIAGTGCKESLNTYQPIVNRRKSSFFRSFNGKASLKKRIRISLKRKIKSEYLTNKKTAWFQQTSTDIGTDYDDSDEEEDQVIEEE